MYETHCGVAMYEVMYLCIMLSDWIIGRLGRLSGSQLHVE